MPEKAGKSMMLVFELIDELVKTHPIDPNRIYVVGNAMGGAGALEAAARRPDLFAGVIARYPETYEESYELLAKMPVAIAVATEDARPSPERQKEIAEEIRDAGNTDLKLFERDAFSNDATYEWLFSQKRSD